MNPERQIACDHYGGNATSAYSSGTSSQAEKLVMSFNHLKKEHLGLAECDIVRPSDENVTDFLNVHWSADTSKNTGRFELQTILTRHGDSPSNGGDGPQSVDPGLTVEGCQESWEIARKIYTAWTNQTPPPDMILVSPLNRTIFTVKPVEVALEAAFGENHGVPVVVYDPLRETALCWESSQIAGKTFTVPRLAGKYADTGDVNFGTVGRKQTEITASRSTSSRRSLSTQWQNERGTDLLRCLTELGTGVHERTGQKKVTTWGFTHHGIGEGYSEPFRTLAPEGGSTFFYNGQTRQLSSKIEHSVNRSTFQPMSWRYPLEEFEIPKMSGTVSEYLCLRSPGTCSTGKEAFPEGMSANRIMSLMIDGSLERIWSEVELFEAVNTGLASAVEGWGL